MIFYFALILTLIECGFGKIGNLAVHKSNSLILTHRQQLGCEEIIPYANRCEKAYEAVDLYCYKYAKSLDKTCDHLYKNLTENCNAKENEIKIKCNKDQGYISSKCGTKLERLESVCKIESTTISRFCMEKYKKMDNICYRKYGRVDLKCNRVYNHYEDLCESTLEENYWYDEEITREVDLDKEYKEIKVLRNLLLNRSNKDSGKQITIEHPKPKGSKPIPVSKSYLYEDYEALEEIKNLFHRSFKYQKQNNDY